VTPPQLKRLFAIMNQCGWSREQVGEVMVFLFQLTDDRMLTMGQYEQLVQVIQSGTYEQFCQQPPVGGQGSGHTVGSSNTEQW
jgi:hypothetical protein